MAILTDQEILNTVSELLVTAVSLVQRLSADPENMEIIREVKEGLDASQVGLLKISGFSEVVQVAESDQCHSCYATMARDALRKGYAEILPAFFNTHSFTEGDAPFQVTADTVILREEHWAKHVTKHKILYVPVSGVNPFTVEQKGPGVVRCWFVVEKPDSVELPPKTLPILKRKD